MCRNVIVTDVTLKPTGTWALHYLIMVEDYRAAPASLSRVTGNRDGKRDRPFRRGFSLRSQLPLSLSTGEAKSGGVVDQNSWNFIVTFLISNFPRNARRLSNPWERGWETRRTDFPYFVTACRDRCPTIFIQLRSLKMEQDPFYRWPKIVQAKTQRFPMFQQLSKPP